MAEGLIIRRGDLYVPALGSYNNPASSGIELYNAGFTQSGLYWIDGGSGKYETYLKMDYGGGWIMVNKSNSIYPTLLTSHWGTGGSDLLINGGSNLDSLNAGNSTQSQAHHYGCPGEAGRSYININNQFALDFNITQVRIKIYYDSDDGGVTCGPYWTSGINGRTIISGSSIQVDTTCANPPNRYSDKNGVGFTVEFYGTLQNIPRLFEAWTACGGSFTMRLLELYVK